MYVRRATYVFRYLRVTYVTDNPNRGDIPWGENVIRLETQVYDVHVPACLKPGEYILRHEVTRPVAQCMQMLTLILSRF